MGLERLNLSYVNALIIDDDRYAVDILTRILRGFGLNRHVVATSGAEAKVTLQNEKFDLVVCEAALPDMRADELVRWLRRLDDDKAKYVPVIILTGHTQIRNIEAARDSGANAVVRKPVSPNVLFDHLIWAANASRTFVVTATYIGPDRRFKSAGPPDGVGRRSTDLSPNVGVATEPNLSQDEIDNFMRPTKVAIE